tara:strand:+ start:991 stop:1179 length:189 start_codon:yes stop_codon:yes gene_type:complete
MDSHALKTNKDGSNQGRYKNNNHSKNTINFILFRNGVIAGFYVFSAFIFSPIFTHILSLIFK